MTRVFPLLLLVCFAMQVQAANPHFKGNSPDITTSPTSIEVDACFAGLGNDDIRVTISATGAANVVLFNPGGQFVPGQNKVPITATASKTISRTEIKNGNVCVSLTAEAPKTVDPIAAGAPNANWTAKVVSVDWDTVQITVVQGGATVIDATFQLKADARAATQVISRSFILKK